MLQKKVTFISSIKLFFLASALLPHQTSFSFSWRKLGHDIMTAGAIIGGVAVAAGGTLLAIDWLMDPSDEQLIINAQSEYIRINTSWHQENTLFQKAFYELDIRQINATVSEPFLYDLAKNAWFQNECQLYQTNPTYIIENKIAKLNEDIKVLATYQNSLSERAQLLQTKKIKEFSDLKNIQGMYDILSKIEELSINLSPLNDYLQRHEQYFSAAFTEWYVYNKYSHEFNICNTYINNPQQFAYELHIYIHQKHAKNTQYPYINYMEELDADLKSLSFQRDRITSFLYYDRMSWITNATTLMYKLHNSISQQYYIEKMVRERVQLEDERNRLLQKVNKEHHMYRKELRKIDARIAALSTISINVSNN